MNECLDNAIASYKKEIIQLKKELFELKNGKLFKKFKKERGEMTPFRIIHLYNMSGTVDYVNDCISFKSWTDHDFYFSVSLNNYNFFFIPSGGLFKWGAFCFGEKDYREKHDFFSEWVDILEFTEKNFGRYVSDKDILNSGYCSYFDFKNECVESHLKTPYSVSMFSLIS